MKSSGRAPSKLLPIGADETGANSVKSSGRAPSKLVPIGADETGANSVKSSGRAPSKLLSIGSVETGSNQPANVETEELSASGAEEAPRQASKSSSAADPSFASNAQAVNEALAVGRPLSPPSPSSPKDSRRGSAMPAAGPGAGPGAGKSAKGGKAMKGPTTKGEVRYPVLDIEPPSPRVELSEKRKSAWQQRVRLSCGSLPQQHDEDEGAQDLLEPPLQWYAEQLSLVCGCALIPASERLLALQARHIGQGLLDEGEQLWHLLLEVATLFAAAAYHVHRAAEVLNRDFIRGPRGGQGHSGPSGGPEAASQQRLPMPPFMPKGAKAAVADLHLHIARLQATGPQLAASLQHLGQGSDPLLEVHRILDALTSRGNKGGFGGHAFGAGGVAEEEDSQGRVQTLFMAVPCIEEAMERLGTLLYLAERAQAAGVSVSANGSGKTSKQTENTARRAVDEGEDFIREDDDGERGGDFDVKAEDNQELIEAAAMAEAPRLSAKASARPVSAGRRRSGPEAAAIAQSPGQEGNESNVSAQEPEKKATEAPKQMSRAEQRALLAKEEEAAKAARGDPPPKAPKTKKKKG